MQVTNDCKIKKQLSTRYCEQTGHPAENTRKSERRQHKQCNKPEISCAGFFVCFCFLKGEEKQEISARKIGEDKPKTWVFNFTIPKSNHLDLGN